MLKYRIYQLLRSLHLVSERCFKKRTRNYSKDYRLLASSRLFDAQWYLDKYVDVRKAGLNPLIHYERYGRNEGEWKGLGIDETKHFFYNRENYLEEPEKGGLSISVVVPVYNALDELRKLVASIEKSLFSSTAEIIFIDDCSSDTEVRSFLCSISQKYTVVYNEANLGFIKTANKGLEISQNDIVVILNEDTQIPSNFEEKIIKCFQSDKNIAFASPISSHTTSFDIPCETYQLDAMADLVDRVSAHRYPAYTPQGFCFCCRREVLHKIGALDTIYGRGYCEEDDLVMRAISNGYRTVLIDDLFVMHRRHASFGVEGRRRLLEHNRSIFLKRWESLQWIVMEEMKTHETSREIMREIAEKRSAVEELQL